MSYRKKVKRRINKKKMIKKIIPTIILLLVISFAFFRDNADKEKSIIQLQEIDRKISDTEYKENKDGKTYYISETGTSTDGTDINSPMSLKTANTKTYNGNDKILFKSGETFYGTINFNVQTSEDEYVYIGSYGDGEKPIISGANIIKDKDAWNLDSQGIYKIDLSDYSNFEGIGKTYLEPYNIGFIADENGNIFGARKKSKDLLENDNDFYCENNFLYIRSNENPSDRLGKIKFVSRNNLVNLSSNTILSNLNIQDTGAHGIVKKTSDFKNVYIHDCIIQNIGGSVITESTFTRYGNGIEFWNQAENTLVQNCIFRNIYDAAYTVQGNTTNTGFKNNICQNNIFIGCSYDIEMFAYNKENKKNNVSLLNQKIQNNISINEGNGWGYNVRADKLASSILVLWRDETIPKDADINMMNNRYFNSRNIFYIDKYNPIDKEHYKNCVKSDKNYIYISNDGTLFLGQGNYQDRSILKEYNQEQNSTFRLLSDDEIDKISNNDILNSNNYDEIKQYYENIEKELKYTDIKNEIINKYEDFANTYNEELNNIVGINTKINNIIKEIKEFNFDEDKNDNIDNIIKNTYSISEDITSAYLSNKINQEKFAGIIKNINDIAQANDSIYNELNISNNADKQEVQDNINKIENLIKDNMDLNLEDFEELIKIAKGYTNQEQISYAQYEYCKIIYTNLSNVIDKKIDEYIKNNPITETYSETDITNKDIEVTLNIGNDTKIINNDGNNKYIFSENGSFTFEYERRGKKFSKEIKVGNIDKNAPEIKGIENQKNYSNEVVPIIKDEHLKEIKLKLNGQEISGYVNGSKLDKEGIYELEAIDMAGNSSKIKFYIIKNGYQIRNDNNIININIDTSVEMFKEKFKVFDQYLIKHEDKEMDDNYNIATGDELENNNGEKFILIVRGDINQDGKFTLSDVSLLKKCYLEIINLNDTQKLAADMNLNGEISLSDVSLIKKKFLGFEKE